MSNIDSINIYPFGNRAKNGTQMAWSTEFYKFLRFPHSSWLWYLLNGSLPPFIKISYISHCQQKGSFFSHYRHFHNLVHSLNTLVLFLLLRNRQIDRRECSSRCLPLFFLFRFLIGKVFFFHCFFSRGRLPFATDIKSWVVVFLTLFKSQINAQYQMLAHCIRVEKWIETIYQISI